MTMKNDTLLLIDFENLYMFPLEQQQIKLSEKGLGYLLSELEKVHKFNYEDVIVPAIWSNFPESREFIENYGISTIDVAGTKANVSDGYLIVEAMLKFDKIKDDIKKVILIGGDGVYVRLVRHFLSQRKEVFLHSWNKGLNSTFEPMKSNSKFSFCSLDTLFDWKEEKEENVKSGWFHETEITSEEEKIIKHLVGIKGNVWYLPMRAKFIKEGTKFADLYPDIKNITDADLFLTKCYEQRIFDKQRRYNDYTKKEDYCIILNKNNLKVKTVLGI